MFLHGSSVYIQNKMQMNQNREPSLINWLQVSHHNQAKWCFILNGLLSANPKSVLIIQTKKKIRTSYKRFLKQKGRSHCDNDFCLNNYFICCLNVLFNNKLLAVTDIYSGLQ